MFLSWLKFLGVLGMFAKQLNKSFLLILNFSGDAVE